MNWLHLVSVFLHILAAVVWVGGMLFLVMIVVPLLRNPELRAKAPLIVRESGRKFKRIGWSCLLLLIVTGLANLHFKGNLYQIASGDFWSSRLGLLFAHKLALVVLLLILSLVHDLWIGPKAVAAWERDPDSVETRRLRGQARWIGRVNLLLALIVLFLAVWIVRPY